MASPCESLRDHVDRNLCARLESGKIEDALLEEERAVPWSHFALEGIEGEKLRHWLFGFRDQGAKSLFQAMMAPARRGGLGVVFDEEESGPARAAMDVYRDRKANCVEFASFFLMAADLLGIPAVPMELFEDAAGHFVEHIRIGVPGPETGEIVNVADLADGRFGPPADGEKGAVRTRREFLADYFNLKAVREKHADAAEGEIDFALRLDPRNHLALYNKAYYAAARGKPRHALSYLLRSIAAYPRYPLAYWNLKRVAEGLGETEIAAWAFERYQALYSNSDDGDAKE